MPDRYVLDAHAVLWFVENNPRLGAAAKSAIDDRESELWLPAIALAEVLRVVELAARWRLPRRYWKPFVRSRV